MSHVHVPKPQSLPQADGIALRAPKTSRNYENNQGIIPGWQHSRKDH